MPGLDSYEIDHFAELEAERQSERQVQPRERAQVIHSTQYSADKPGEDHWFMRCCEYRTLWYTWAGPLSQ
jgi:hypothetical protein